MPASGAGIGAMTTVGENTTVVERTKGDGTVYQTGRLTDQPDSVDPPAQPTVTGEITAEIEDAEDNIVYAVVGYANGEVLETTRMDGLGNGSVTTGVQVREEPRGTYLVWTFYAVTSAEDAVDAFDREAGNGDFGDGATAEGTDATHDYTNAGNYTVTVTVTDEQGDSATASREVETTLQYRFDDDDGVVDMDELQEALKEVDRSGDSDVDLDEIRERIQEINGGGDDDEGDGSDEPVDSDGDGIPDEREETGIPVLSAHQYSEAGENANVTDPPENDYPQIVLDNVVRLKTDPDEADTDGDGLDDGVEIAKKLTYDASDQPWIPSSYDGNLTLYLLNSDPTGPDTDDTGLDDKTEGKMGSDPTTPEWVSVDVTVPVTGKEGCTPVTDGNGVRDCSKGIYGGDLFGIDGGPYHVLRPSASSPRGAGWLSDIDTDENRNYFLVGVTVDVSYENVPADARPDYMQFTEVTGFQGGIVGQGPSKSEITSGYSPTLPEDGGTKRVFIVIESGESFGNKDIGKLRARIDVEEDSVVDRGDGGDAYVETQTPLVVQNNVAFTSEDAARAMVEEATKQWAQGTIAAVAPTGGAVAKASFGGAAGAAAKVYVDGVATLTGIPDAGPLSEPGQDEMIAQAIVAEGAVPGYLNRDTSTPPVSNTVIVWYRES